MAKEKRALTPQEEMAEISRLCSHRTFEAPATKWLNTGNVRLNAVLGSSELGMAYGRIAELYGPNSNGKTMLALLIAALAQADGAQIAWIDLENSLDQQWTEANGVDYSKIYPFRCKLVKENDDDPGRLQTTQELLQEVEMWMARRHKENPDGKQLIVVDSLAAMLVEDEAEGGLTDQNLRTGMALPKFLSKLLRRWVGYAASYNAMMILVNQIRISPMAFGNPERTTGGEATKFYAHVRVEVRRAPKGGQMKNGSQVIGLRGTLKNVKNKAGGGSVEGHTCGYATRFGKKSWQFPTVEQVKKDARAGGEDGDE